MLQGSLVIFETMGRGGGVCITLGVAVWVRDFVSGVGEGSGLWRLFVVVGGSPPFVFVVQPGGTRSLGMVAGDSLGVLYFFPPWVFLKGGEGVCFSNSAPPCV